MDLSRLRSAPEKHELETADHLAGSGYDIVFIPPNNSPDIHTPDITIDGVDWELKAPVGKSKRTIENNFRQANKQSENIVFDLRRAGISEKECIKRIMREYELRPRVKRIMIIGKNGNFIKLP